MTNILQRLLSPTPAFFRKLRTVALALTAVSGVLLAAPIALPVIVVHVAGYLAVAGGVATAVCQAAVDPE